MSLCTSQCGEIVQYEQTKNIFVVRQDGQELFQISFPDSIIRKFYTTSLGYILFFQARAAITQEKGNICLVSFSGEILWWVEKRNESCYTTRFVDFRFEDNYIVAYGGSYDYWIDIHNGKIVKLEFVK